MPLCSSSGGGFHLIVNEVEVTSVSDTFTGGELGTGKQKDSTYVNGSIKNEN